MTKILSKIGQAYPEIQYLDRPTVKVIIKKDDKILLLNDGLLPGGGVDNGESNEDAIFRELQEELGVTVKGVRTIGTVIQYRNFLNKKYLVYGYTATFDSKFGSATPRDEGEAKFAMQWLSTYDALELVQKSITVAKSASMTNDANQGKLYNLMTTYELLKAF